jgi:hypothetical protein
MKRSVLTVLLLLFIAATAFAQAPTPAVDAERIAKLERQVQELQSKVDETKVEMGDLADKFSLTILYMFFCGTWAASTGRNFWLWWFLGIFNVFTLFLLLWKVGQDWKRERLTSVSGKPGV